MNINDDIIVKHTKYAHDGECFERSENCGKVVKRIFFKSGKFSGQLREIKSNAKRIKRTIQKTDGFGKCDPYLSGWIPVKKDGKLDHNAIYTCTYYITNNPPKEYSNHTQGSFL